MNEFRNKQLLIALFFIPSLSIEEKNDDDDDDDVDDVDDKDEDEDEDKNEKADEDNKEEEGKKIKLDNTIGGVDQTHWWLIIPFLWVVRNQIEKKRFNAFIAFDIF